MPKIPVLKPKNVVKRYEKLRFVKDRQTGSHVILYNKKMKQRAVILLHVKNLP